ncbi:WD40-repeat-containing domain protein [Zychaea mexicana]|uniref:WD40-repeat-containing domain protein n=1 Tax=Zychaea mexicana TaxID=64656 RepID=UPI0022FDF3E5|nr:WD40-repeat-containing domain protein [Zychaea mexicana]KAI9484810.1 WD40-repeat-containing domain protein [Zychaea mexicana]
MNARAFLLSKHFATTHFQQGIDWESRPVTRKMWREKRLASYLLFAGLGLWLEKKNEKPDIKKISSDQQYYSFKYAKLNERCNIGHFQLRNLLWATSKNNVYYMYEDSVRQWSPQLCSSREILNVRTANAPQSRIFTISSMACAENILFTGGSKGEFACRRLDDMTAPVHYGITTEHINGISNHIHITESLIGGIKAIVSSNDMKTRFINMDTLAIENTISFPFPVNCSSLCPDKRIMCVVGDATETMIVDSTTGAGIHSVDEHSDFSFACCWSPNGIMFATGNQDKTTRIYDIRYPSHALHVLGGKAGAIRSLQFSNDGRFLVAAEPIDFVHIYDTKLFENSQVIDMFGEITGVGKW